MDSKQVKAILNRSRVAAQELERMTEVLQNIRSRAEGTQARRFNITGKSHGSGEKSPAEQIISMQEIIQRKYFEMLNYIAYNLYLIYLIEPSIQRCILLMRYICNYQWDIIAEKTYYDFRSVHRLHRQTLERLAGMLDTGAALDFEQWKSSQPLTKVKEKELAQYCEASIALANRVVKELQRVKAP